MNDYGYGLWALVVINSAVFILFAISFFHPQGGRDWRALGGFSAFIVALFAEMYGYPLTIYLAGSVLGDKLGLGHNAGHLWADLVGWKGDPHLSPFHVASPRGARRRGSVRHRLGCLRGPHAAVHSRNSPPAPGGFY